VTTFDPRDFIRGPFKTCPYCGAEQLGVVGIHGTRLTRRCRACLRPGHGDHSIAEDLPPITKTILYLDQFAVSNFAYRANPELDPGKTMGAGRWSAIYDAVFALLGVQVLVCPSSGFHTDESLARLHDDDFMKAFDRTQLRLSVGVGFPDAISIEVAQLRAAAALSTEAIVDPSDRRLLADARFSNDPHAWASDLQIGVATSSFYAGVATEVGDGLANQGAVLQEAFEAWRSLTATQAAEQFALELAAYGPSVLRASIESMQGATLDPWAGLSRSVQRFNAVASQYRGLDAPEDGYTGAVAFFLGDTVKLVPKVRLGASMYAVLARQAGSGMKSVESSFATDLAIVSTILPYCDGIVVDGRCAEVLRQPPARAEVKRWGTAVQSARDLSGFRSWLDDIAVRATPEHLAAVEAAYGPGPVARFRSVFSQQ
jgi:hypothetical protein